MYTRYFASALFSKNNTILSAIETWTQLFVVNFAPRITKTWEFVFSKTLGSDFGQEGHQIQDVFLKNLQHGALSGHYNGIC